jgi:sugar (pentulose or hexulose) kinase
MAPSDARRSSRPTQALGIDIGTSGVRAAVIEEGGGMLSMASTRFAALGGDPFSPATWFGALEATLLRLSVDCDLAKVGALAVDGTSGTIVAVDIDGEPIGPARMYDEPCDDPSHRLGERWLVGGASNTGGKVLETLFPEGDLDALAATLRPETPTGLHLYPLARPGERFPINDPAFPPRLTPRPPERERFFQAVLEGIGEIEALAYRRLGELGAPPIRSLRSIGGGAANPGWTRIRQGLIHPPFTSALSHEARVGSALLALRGSAAS